MAIKKRYIPLRDDDFFNWQGNFVNQVVVNAAAWGIPSGAVTALSASRAVYEPLYFKAQDKTNRTRTDVRKHREGRETYEKELRAFVKKYCDTLPIADKSLLGLTIPDTEPSPAPVITDIPVVALRAMGGGEIEVRVQTTRDATRYSMHPSADLIEYRYTMLGAGQTPPADAEDYPRKDVSSRAKFVIKLATANTGKRFYGLFRWVHTARPKQEGPWSESISVVIA